MSNEKIRVTCSKRDGVIVECSCGDWAYWGKQYPEDLAESVEYGKRHIAHHSDPEANPYVPSWLDTLVKAKARSAANV